MNFKDDLQEDGYELLFSETRERRVPIQTELRTKFGFECFQRENKNNKFKIIFFKKTKSGSVILHTIVYCENEVDRIHNTKGPAVRYLYGSSRGQNLFFVDGKMIIKDEELQDAYVNMNKEHFEKYFNMFLLKEFA